MPLWTAFFRSLLEVFAAWEISIREILVGKIAIREIGVGKVLVRKVAVREVPIRRIALLCARRGRFGRRRLRKRWCWHRPMEHGRKET